MTTTTEAGATSAPAGPVPRIVDGLPIETYHADRTSISSSGVRALLDPGCPAQFKYDRDHPRPPKKEFDLGNAVHGEVLGSGPDIEVLEYGSYRSNKAQLAAADARASGMLPLLTHEYEQVQAMATAIRQHPLAGPLFTGGIAEQSLYWVDEATGITCRCRPDYLKQYPDLTLAVDLKTTKDASPQAVSKAIYDYGYFQQDPFYIDGIQAATGQQARFIFVFVDKRAPYLITVRELSDADRAIGRAKNARALRIYAECTKTGVWPDWTGPTDSIPYISLPAWAAQREAEEFFGVKEIGLNSGLVAIVDDEDFDRVSAAGNWYKRECLNTSYAQQNYRRDDGTRSTRRMHNFVTGLPYVDHINGNGLDNRRANLRPATASQNQANQRKRRDNTSGFRGVQWHPPGRTWRAVIRIKGRLVSLGYYPVREDAARAYDRAAVEFFGPYARPNFPQEYLNV